MNNLASEAISPGQWAFPVNQRNLDAAWTLVETEDFPNPWVPDVLGFRDYVADSANIKATAARLVQTGQEPARPRLIGVPKNDCDYRPAALVPVIDLVAYSYLVTCLLPGGTSPEFVTYSGLRSAAETEPAKAWASLQGTLADGGNDGSGWTLHLDIENFFMNIECDSLLNFLHRIDAGNWTGASLAKFLQSWLSPNQKVGLPQGPGASRRLASLFLTQVDWILREMPWPSARFVDDFWILLDEQDEQNHAFGLVDAACRRLGLSLSRRKTRLSRGSTSNLYRELPAPGKSTLEPSTLLRLMKSLDSKLDQPDFIDRDLVATLIGHLTAASVAPWPQLLRRIVRLTPLAPQLARFLLPWLTSRSVIEELEAAVAKEDPQKTRYLRWWLSAAMVDAGAGIPNNWLESVRVAIGDQRVPGEIRSLAAAIVAIWPNREDVHNLRQMASTGDDAAAARGAIVALARIGALTGDTLGRLKEQRPSLAATLSWLENARLWPNMLSPVAGWSYL